MRRTGPRRLLVAAGALAVVAAAIVLADPTSSRVRTPSPTPTLVVPATVSEPPRQEQLWVAGGAGMPTRTGFDLVARPDGAYVMAFSPDGRRAAYTTPGAGSGTTSVTLPGLKAPRVVAGFSTALAWTADGEDVVLVDSTGLRRYTVATSRSIPIPLPTGWVVWDVDVSPSDRLLLVGSVRGRSALMTVDVDGGDPRVVLTDPQRIYLARWSPDARFIAFVHRGDPRDAWDRGEVTVQLVRVDGNGRMVFLRLGYAGFLGTAPGLDWSPEGRLAWADSSGAAGVPEVYPLQKGITDLVGWSEGPIAWRPASERTATSP